jgi:hypothetical protein
MTKTYRILEILWLVFFAICLLYGTYQAYLVGFVDHTKLLFLGAALSLVLFTIRRKQRVKAEQNEASQE